MGPGGSGRMVVGCSGTGAISAYHHWCCEFESRFWRGAPNTTLVDDICQLLVAGHWFSLDTLVSSTNATYHHDITKILLKVRFIAITSLTRQKHLILRRTKNIRNNIIHQVKDYVRSILHKRGKWMYHIKLYRVHAVKTPCFNFLFTYLFSITFLYYFISFSLV